MGGNHMILTTTPSIEGSTIKEYKGIVVGEVISGVDFRRGFYQRYFRRTHKFLRRTLA